MQDRGHALPRKNEEYFRQQMRLWVSDTYESYIPQATRIVEETMQS